MQQLDSSNTCTRGDDFHLDGAFYEDVSKKVKVDKKMFQPVCCIMQICKRGAHRFLKVLEPWKVLKNQIGY